MVKGNRSTTLTQLNLYRIQIQGEHIYLHQTTQTYTPDHSKPIQQVFITSSRRKFIHMEDWERIVEWHFNYATTDGETQRSVVEQALDINSQFACVSVCVYVQTLTPSKPLEGSS